MLYWELARRLLLGARANASTRLNMLLALGMLTLSSMCLVILMGLNAGLGKIEDIDSHINKNTLPNSVNIYPLASVEGLSGKRAATQRARIQRAFEQADLPKKFHYFSLSPWIIIRGQEEKNIPALAKAYAKNKEIKRLIFKDDISVAESNKIWADHIENEKMLKTLTKATVQNAGPLCAFPGGPSGNAVWVAPNFSEKALEKGDKVVLVSPTATHTMGAGAQIPQMLVGHVEKFTSWSMAAEGCAVWVSWKRFEALKMRQPDEVVETYSWGGLSRMQDALISKNFGDRDVVFAKNINTKEDPALLAKLVKINDPKLKTSTRDNDRPSGFATQKAVFSLIMALVGGAAFYQLCALLMMLGIQAKFDIAMLRSMGMSKVRIMVVFLMAGTLMTVLGTSLGTVIGYLVLPQVNAITAQAVHLIAPEQALYWIPWAYDIPLTTLTLCAGVIAGGIVGLLPAWMAARAHPAQLWSETA